MFGSEVEYVTLRLPDENDYFASSIEIKLSDFRFKTEDFGEVWYQNTGSSTQVIATGKNILTSDLLGVRLFDNKGVFVKNLLLSEFEGKKNSKKVEIIFDTYKQAVLRGFLSDRCYLALHDHSSKEVFVGEYKIGSNSMDDIAMTQVRRYPSGTFIDNQSLFKIEVSRNLLRGYTDEHPIAVSFNMQGDTLCKYHNHAKLDKEVLKNLKGIAYTDYLFLFRSEGKLFFRQSYCDTIFHIKSASRFVPAYLFDFGDKRVTIEEGITAKTQGKLLPNRLYAFKNSILLIFSEGRDCSKCREKGEVTFHGLLFDKKTGRATPLDLKNQYPEDIMIENDIDGGFPIPLNSIDTESENIIATFDKNRIERILKNNAKNLSAETVSKLKSQADALKANELLVVKIY